MFKYGIKIDGELVAKFKNGVDRDYCLDILTDIWEDCEVEPVDCED
jgi:hypothetical protein